MPAHASYRCYLCRELPERCASCRARRAAVRTAARAKHREDGRCIDCARKAAPGLTRCHRHRRQNRELVAAARVRATSAASGAS